MDYEQTIESMSTTDEEIQKAATVENAKAYAETSEKFVFCVDLLGISAHHPKADYWVNQLEDKFDEINGVSGS